MLQTLMDSFEYAITDRILGSSRGHICVQV